MRPPTAPILDVKVSAPAPRRDVVERPRLFAQLDAGLRRPLSLVVAPAGFGKTTLLSAWRLSYHGRDRPVAWVSLDREDNDPDRFWSYVIAALYGLQPGAGTVARHALRHPRDFTGEVVLTALLSAVPTLPQDATLVLDDYHLIKAPAIHHALGYLIDHLPPRLRLIIATRSDPPLPLPRLRAADALSEIRAADLRFNLKEVEGFLKEVVGLPLKDEAVAALGERTEGWIAGLQLAAISLRGRPSEQADRFVEEFTGSNRFVMDYLVDEVFRLQPRRTQAFLLRTAVLDRMCAPLCDAVLAEEDGGRGSGSTPREAPGAVHGSQRMLEQLERDNLFVVPLDDERRWYRYHHLFSDVLRNRLNQSQPGIVDSLHRQASAWFEAQGLIPDALAHALAVNDRALAARLIERHGASATGVVLPHDGNGLHPLRRPREFGPEPPALVPPLTTREVEVLRLIAAGASNREIAGTLVVSIGTVKKHGNNIFGKLGVESRTQAVARAMAMHLI